MEQFTSSHHHHRVHIVHFYRTGKAVKAQRVDFSDEDVRQINLKYKCSGEQYF